MEVNLFEALKKLKSALVIIENRIDKIEKHPDVMDSYYEEYMFLLKIQRHLKNVELIESPDKLKPILEMVEKRIDEIRIDEFENRTVKNGMESRNLVKIQTYLEYVEKKLIDVETGNQGI